MELLEYEEFLTISYKLESYDSLFYALWKLAKIYLVDDTDKGCEHLKTAAVRFDSEGREIQFLFNREFWQSLDEPTKNFVVCHECMHIILCHGFRMKKLKAFNAIGNIAADLLVNTLLTRNFGLKRNEIMNQEKYCWFDTVFDEKEAKELLRNFNSVTFEYLYQKLMLQQEKILQGQSETVDDHSMSGDGEEIGDLLKEVFDSVNKEMTYEEKKDFASKLPEGEKDEANENFEEIEEQKVSSAQAAGTTGGSGTLFVPKQPVKKKKKWETIVKDWSARQIKPLVEQESWIKSERRNHSFLKDKEMFLPCILETEKKEKNKLDVWFFLDTSGSCVGYAQRFFKAADTIPLDKFNIRLFCFDTRVYETSITSRKLYGFGGTSFTCIERAIQAKLQAENKPYPHAVWILTDGYGDKVTPEMPKRWYWFLTASYKACIPPESKTYMLSQFE